MNGNIITCYEHEKLIVNNSENGFTEMHLKALQMWLTKHEKTEEANPYFSLIHNGIKMSSWVGLLQVGNLSIEVLPKLSRKSNEEPQKWKYLLLKMLVVTKHLPMNETDIQYQDLSRQSLSEIFFKSFVYEIKNLIHKGLLKSYRQETKNRYALKGKLDFSENIKTNLVHEERFVTKAIVYDYQSYFNRILIEALRVIKNVGCVKSEVKKILDDWGYIQAINPTTIEWNRITYDRRTDIYRKAMVYARMILNGFNPSLSNGKTPIISFLFDMNSLFEEFVYVMIRRSKKYDKVVAQKGKRFWESDTNKVNLYPDIQIEKDDERTILDTKWKMIDTQRPSDADLRQIFAYCHLFIAKEGYLVYPKYEDSPNDLNPKDYKTNDCACGIHFFDLFKYI